MIPSSLRWRLPLSYAGVALLAALVLGAVLLAILQGYYRQQELAYLRGNGQAIGEEIGRLLNEQPLSDALEAQVKGFAFLTQARVKVLDRDSLLLVDSGDPRQNDSTTRLSVEVALEGEGQQFTQSFTVETGQAGTGSTIVLENEFVSQGSGQTSVMTQTTAIEGGAADPALVSRLSVAGTLFGFGLNSEAGAAQERSNLVVEQPVFNLRGELVGTVELSKGPAYGRTIVRSVAWGWAAAGVVAVVLAALAGWIVSQRLTRPLLSLTETTQRMAGGDLSVRAEQPEGKRQDELGMLAGSFNQMAARVEETVTVLRRFVADAAHELQTPLTALRTDLELAADKANDNSEEEPLNRARGQIERLERLTAGLLNLSHLEAGVMNSRKDVVDLGQLLTLAVEPYASRAEQKGVAFHVVRPSEPLMVMGDEHQLRQALGNLLDNALKFTAAGGSVDVDLRMDGEWVAVAVADTGIGIAAGDRPYLFERFHRGRNAVAYPGSGLGLAIARTIISHHGGEIEVVSDEGGSRFIVRLPLAT